MKRDIQQTTCDECGAVNHYDPKSIGSTGLRGWFSVKWVPGPDCHGSPYNRSWDFCSWPCAQKFFNNFHARYINPDEGAAEQPGQPDAYLNPKGPT